MSTPPASPETEQRASLSARETAYRWISEAVLTGRYDEGEFLDETTLARALGMSRTPVREALHRLQAERYVDLVPRRGAQVRVITAAEMQEIYETRYLIESASLTKICQQERGAPPGVGSLLDSMEEAGSRSEWATFAELDQRFHMSMVSHQGNAVLSDLYRALRPRHIRLSVRTITEGQHRRPTIEREHRELVAAMEASDAEECVRILGEHLRSVPELMNALQH